MRETITFEFILKSFLEKTFPENFQGMLEHWLAVKREMMQSHEIKNFAEKWVQQVITGIEIGMQLDREKFSTHKDFWKGLLGYDWKVEKIEDGGGLITWKRMH